MAYVKARHDFAVTLRTDLLEHPDIQILEVSTAGQSRVTIVNVYNDPRLKDACALQLLRQVDLPNHYPIIITGDFNLHHVLWSKGRVAHDHLTEEIVDWLSSSGYTLLNTKGEITHPARHPREKDSVIDLSFTNAIATANDTFKDWCVDPSLSHDSDHYAIRFVIDEGRQEILNPTGIRHSLKETKPQEWVTAFDKEIEVIHDQLEVLTLQDNPAPRTLDLCEELLTKAIQNATAKTGKKYRPSTASKPWWDEDLSNIARQLAQARQEEADGKRANPNFSSAQRRRIRTLRNLFHRMCRKKKRTWVMNTLHDAKDNDIWRFNTWSKGLRNYPSPPIQRGEGMEPAVSHTDKCEALRAELYQPPPRLATAWVPDVNSPIEDQLPFEEITEEEVYKAIHKVSMDTAPGFSQVTYKALKWAWLSEYGKKYLVLLMRKCLQAGYHPRNWRRAIAIALRKPNKPNYSNPRAYRLITLLECMGKILERIVARRLTYLAGKYDLVPPSQFGGRSNSSTSDALLTFVNDIQSAWNHGYATSSLMFDIKGYFDFVNHQRLLCELRRKKIPLPYLKWTQSFLSERQATICLDGQVGEMKMVENGIPQGSPLSPILAAFYTAELLELFQETNSISNTTITPHPTIPTTPRLMMYVDDGNIYVSSPSLENNVSLLERAYERVHRWLQSAGLSADPVKRELMHYCKPRNKRFKTSPAIRLCDNPSKAITAASTVRWLGIHFDRQLRFEQHAKLTAIRGEHAVNGLMMLGNTIRGLSQIHLRRLYMACVIPKILYGAPIWWNGTRYQKNPLEKVQHRALHLICAAFRTTPIKALEIEASIPPIHHQARLLSRRCGIRFNKLPESNLVIQRLGPEWRSGRNARYAPPLPPIPQSRKKTSKYKNLTTTLLQIAKFSDSKHERIDPFTIPPWRRLQSAYRSRISISTHHTVPRGGDGDKKKIADEHNQDIKALSRSPSNLIVYTDGSMVNKSGFRRVGAGCVLYHMGREVNNNKMGLGGHAEIHDAELAALMMGITMATTYAREHGVHNIYLYADNTSAIPNTFDPKPTGGQHYTLTFYNRAINFLDENESHRISISWCPSHSGIKGNERADSLAKQATHLGRTSPIGVTRSNAIRRAKLATLKEWKQEWSKAPKHGWFAVADRIPPSLQPTKHARLLSSKRELFGCVVQSRTGHGYTGEFRRRFFPTEPTLCPCGDGSIETREHILTACPRYNEWRWKLRDVSRDIVLSEILGTAQGIEALASFLEASGAYTQTGTIITTPRPSHTPNPEHHLDDLSEHDDDSTIGPEADDEDYFDHG